jgi:hypothetical protein
MLFHLEGIWQVDASMSKSARGILHHIHPVLKTGHASHGNFKRRIGGASLRRRTLDGQENRLPPPPKLISMDPGSIANSLI